MMIDLVVRLRDYVFFNPENEANGLMREADFEIERLQRLVKLLEADNKRLRAILCDLQGSPNAEHDDWGHDD